MASVGDSARLDDARLRELIELQRDVVDLHRRATEIDLWTHDVLSVEALRTDVVPAVSELLASATALLAHAHAYQCTTDADFDAFPPSESSSRIRSSRAPRLAATDAVGVVLRSASTSVLTDVAFLGKLELEQRAARVARVAASPYPADVVTECDGALHRVARVLGALDVALARTLGELPTLPLPSALDDALRTRRALARARAFVRATDRPEGRELARRLRLGAAALGAIVSWHATPALELEDRQALVDLHRAVFAWLVEPPDDRVARALWDELVEVLGELDRVTNRREVAEHDAGIVRRALAVVTADASEVPLSTLGELERLAGLAPTVDTLLESSWRSLASAWRPLLVKLAERLGVA